MKDDIKKRKAMATKSKKTGDFDVEIAGAQET